MNFNYYGAHTAKLIEELSRLPGIGGKSAQRLAFYIINMPQENAESLANSILCAKSYIKYCKCCCNLSDTDLCRICADESRDKSTIMVVERPKDMAAYERTGNYKGYYHILHGSISPLNGITPDDLKIKELLGRLKKNEASEVIIATNPTVEGEATAMYLSRIIKPLGITVSRIAHGIPVGGELEYVDDVTLARALEGRTPM